MKFTKKPVTIEAIQWTGANLREVICFTDGPPDVRHDHAAMKWEEYNDLVARDGLKIFTLEGKMNAAVGDWIIKGVKGEHYPCKPDIFEMTYGPAAPERSGKLADDEAIAVVIGVEGLAVPTPMWLNLNNGLPSIGTKLYTRSAPADSSSNPTAPTEALAYVSKVVGDGLAAAMADSSSAAPSECVSCDGTGVVRSDEEDPASEDECARCAAPSPTRESLDEYAILRIYNDLLEKAHKEGRRASDPVEFAQAIIAALAAPRQTEDGSGLPSDDDVYQEMQARRDSRAVYISTGCVSDVMQVVRDLAASGSSAAAVPPSVQGGVPEGLIEAATAWWINLRPFGWSERDHFEVPTANCSGTSKTLAVAVAKMLSAAAPTGASK